MNFGRGKTSILAIAILIVIVIIVIIKIFPVIASVSGSSRKSFDLNQQQVFTLTEKANKGDIASAKRLAEYYLMSVPDVQQGFLWLERAALLGDQESKKKVKFVVDEYGLDVYREFIKRTNYTYEKRLINSIYQTNTTETIATEVQ